MLRSITFPMHTLSENEYRGMNKFVKARKTKKQRADVSKILTQIPRTRSMINGAPNRFEVVLVRISAGELDDDNLRGALKSVRDEVAAWIGLDDKDPRIAWKYDQQKTERGTCGVRVDVHDHEAGESRIVHLGLAHSASKTAKGTKAATKGARNQRQATARRTSSKARPKVIVPPTAPQEPIRFVTGAAVLPWVQKGDDELVVTELPAFENVETPPDRTHARDPQGQRITITCRGKFIVDDLGPVWLYAPEGQRFDADEWGLERIGGSP